MFSIKENYFSEEECEKIISFSQTNQKVYSENLFPNIEAISYHYFNIDIDNDNKWIFEKLFSFIEQTTNIRILKPLSQIHLHQYTQKDKFDVHRDDNVPTQVFAVGVCLNEKFDGGYFQLFEPDFIIPKKIGTTYLFDTHRKHQITEILDGERWSLIAFFNKENIKINNLI